MGRDEIVELRRLKRAAGVWARGRGLLAVHTGLFVVAATVLTLLNVARSPHDLWFWQPLLPWAILLVAHAGLVLWSARRPEGETLPVTDHAGSAASVATLAAGAMRRRLAAMMRSRSAARGQQSSGGAHTSRTWQTDASPRAGLRQGWDDTSRRVRVHARSAFRRGSDQIGRITSRTRAAATLLAGREQVAPGGQEISGQWPRAEAVGPAPSPEQPAPLSAAQAAPPPEANGAPRSEWVPAEVEALWSSAGATERASGDATAAPNGKETWPETPVSPNLASPTVRLLAARRGEPEVSGYQMTPPPPAEDIVLHGPTPRDDAPPPAWSDLQAEASAWLARREKDIASGPNGKSHSLAPPDANGHHGPKRAEG